MSYYFPFGALDSTRVLLVSYSLSSMTASVPASTNISALTASYAFSLGSTPVNGTPGQNSTSGCNALLAPSGSIGSSGPTGSKGLDKLTCPPGTVECPGLNVSLSAAYFDGFTSGANAYVPSGSQFSIVCMEIPVGCTSTTAGCPGYLYITQPAIQ